MVNVDVRCCLCLLFVVSSFDIKRKKRALRSDECQTAGSVTTSSMPHNFENSGSTYLAIIVPIYANYRRYQYSRIFARQVASAGCLFYASSPAGCDRSEPAYLQHQHTRSPNMMWLRWHGSISRERQWQNGMSIEA